MTTQALPELISFKVCPFVQRSAITLLEKNIEFKTTYVDLQNLPDWFATVSPLGKVPVLRVADTVVFESAVIAEYLDERYSPSLHPKDLLEKAHHRSWTEFASDLTMNMFAMLYETSESAFNEKRDRIAEQFSQVEKVLDANGDFFAGEAFSLVDAAYAPIFVRLELVRNVFPLNLFDETSPLARWRDALLARPSVKNSVVDDFETLFLDYLENSGGYLAANM